MNFRNPSSAVESMGMMTPFKNCMHTTFYRSSIEPTFPITISDVELSVDQKSQLVASSASGGETPSSGIWSNTCSQKQEWHGHLRVKKHADNVSHLNTNPMCNDEVSCYTPLYHCRSQRYSGNTLACCARGPRFKSRCGQKFVFSRKSLRYAALGMGCTLTAVPRSTRPSTLRGTVNKYQPYGWVIIHGDERMFGL